MAHQPEVFDTSRVRDDDAHWDALAARIADRAAASADAGLVWITRGNAGVVAASLVVAAALVAAAIPSRAAPPTDAAAALVIAIAPSDMVGRSLVSLDQPPAIGSLVLGVGSRDPK